MKRFIKKYMIAGTIALVPVVATIWVLKALILWLDGILFSLLPTQLTPKYLIGYNVPGLGLVLTIVIILLAGVFTRLYIGRKLVQIGDSVFARLPFGRSIYNATKHVLHTTLSDKGQKARRVVLVEYPKEGSYVLGFLTGKWDRLRSAEGEKEGIIVFVPTTPNPTSGFMLIVPEDSTIPTNLSIEEASKLIISGGLLARKADSA